MTDAEKTKALHKAIRDFNNTVKAARARYREKIRSIIKKSDEKKAQAIKKSI
jgi:hypothetical protein